MLNTLVKITCKHCLTILNQADFNKTLTLLQGFDREIASFFPTAFTENMAATRICLIK